MYQTRINQTATAMKPDVAEELIRQMREIAEAGETYELRDYQGGRKVIEIFVNGKSEGMF